MTVARNKIKIERSNFNRKNGFEIHFKPVRRRIKMSMRIIIKRFPISKYPSNVK